jgi:GH24 family phage-related lysozyme (muramidase)
LAPRLEGEAVPGFSLGISNGIWSNRNMVPDPATPAVLAPGLLASVTPVLIRHEGERFSVYDDTEGIPTIGVGLALMSKAADGALVPSQYAENLCSRCGVIYPHILAGVAGLTQVQSRCLLNYCIIDVIEWLTRLFPSFWSYSQPRQIAMVDIGFNLGQTKFRGFKEMIRYILAENWEGAAQEALHSKAAAELPSRYEYDAGLLRNG